MIKPKLRMPTAASALNLFGLAAEFVCGGDDSPRLARDRRTAALVAVVRRSSLRALAIRLACRLQAAAYATATMASAVSAIHHEQRCVSHGSIGPSLCGHALLQRLTRSGQVAPCRTTGVTSSSHS